MTLVTSICWETVLVEPFCAEHRHAVRAWLSAGEQQELSPIRARRRYASGVAARIVAKQLFRQVVSHHSDARDIEILSRDSAGKHIRPCVWLSGEPANCGISIAHTDDVVLVALAPHSEQPLGVDLVRAAPLERGFVRAWFTESEVRMVEQGDELEACRLWAIKEAAYKALNRNEPFRPRRFSVRRLPAGDYACVYGEWDLGQRGEIRLWECFDHIAVLLSFSHPCECERYTDPG